VKPSIAFALECDRATPPGNRCETLECANLTRCPAPCVDLNDERATLTFGRLARNATAAVVGHGRILRERMQAFGGRRCAFPPYGPARPRWSANRLQETASELQDFCESNRWGYCFIGGIATKVTPTVGAGLAFIRRCLGQRQMEWGSSARREPLVLLERGACAALRSAANVIYMPVIRCTSQAVRRVIVISAIGGVAAPPI
jgi:hypothetical protein